MDRTPKWRYLDIQTQFGTKANVSPTFTGLFLHQHQVLMIIQLKLQQLASR